ncbi:MAG: Txe/YoeB family addiction module toxin [Rhodobacteraceae bacterium]|nr:Txe/YoeB family addiction module toxin [Paracoccaceae bacterium]
MIVSFDPLAWEGYLHWQRQDKVITRKINGLIKEIQRHPFEGTGKPEPLKGNLSGFWSRRINREHRLVYRVKGNTLEIAQCRYHY